MFSKVHYAESALSRVHFCREIYVLLLGKWRRAGAPLVAALLSYLQLKVILMPEWSLWPVPLSSLSGRGMSGEPRNAGEGSGSRRRQSGSSP